MLVGLSPLVNHVKDIVFVCKLGSLARSVLFIVHLMSLLYPLDERVVLSVAVCYIICKSWVASHLNNMAAHLASGNISETTISSFQLAFTTLITSISQVVFVSLIKYNGDEPDYTNAIISSSVCGLTSSFVYTIFFQGELSKHVLIRKAERAIRASSIRRTKRNFQPNYQHHQKTSSLNTHEQHSSDRMV